MNFKKSHIDNKGFGDTKNGLDGHGFEPHLDHERRTKVFLFFYFMHCSIYEIIFIVSIGENHM